MSSFYVFDLLIGLFLFDQSVCGLCVCSPSLWPLYSLSQLVDDRIFPLHEVSLLDVLSRIGDESQIEGQVVYACYLHGQEFLCLEEVMQVSLGCDTVDVASVRVYGTEVHFQIGRAHV